MTNTNLGKRLQVLEEMGFDTSKYNLEINGNQIEITGIAYQVVEDKQIDNKKLFRRWITAQTFKMIYEPTYNYTTRQREVGWDNYLRNRYDYKYQFTMMLDEIKTLVKLQARDKEDFEERSNFFNKEVVVATCKHYLRQLNKYVENNWNSKTDTVKLSKYGVVGAEEYVAIVASLMDIIKDMEECREYSELYTYLKKFINKMNKVPTDTPKCPEWKTAFKGSGAYYSLRNLILFHRCILKGCANKQESIAKLESCLNTYKGEYWRFHYMLLETIEFNNFNLKESIQRTK